MRAPAIHPARARLTLGIDGLTSDVAAHTVERVLADLPTLTATADVTSRSLHLESSRLISTPATPSSPARSTAIH